MIAVQRIACSVTAVATAQSTVWVSPLGSLHPNGTSSAPYDTITQISPLARPLCTGDINHSGLVGAADLGLLLQAWDREGPVISPADLNGDERVDGADLGLLLQNWDACPE